MPAVTCPMRYIGVSSRAGVKVLTHESEVSSAEGLPTVDPSEIAFAMALFVAAAKGRVHASDIGTSGFPLADKHVEFFGLRASRVPPALRIHLQ